VQRLLALAFGFFMILAACRGGESTRPIFSVTAPDTAFDTEMDCQTSPDRCSKILSGINHLQVHKSQACRDAGSDLMDRYNDQSGTRGFRDGSGQAAAENYLWVNMSLNVGGSSSGYTADNGYVNISPDWWNTANSSNAAQTGQALAHEATHLWGIEDPYHSTGNGSYYYDTCGEV
jgi:hypothetical protein